MDWLNLHIPTVIRSPEYVGSSPAERGTWLSVLAYACEIECGGRLVGAGDWKDRQWQQACGVTLREVRAAGRLMRFDGSDLLVNGYPMEKQRQVQNNRGVALAGAMTKWGGSPSGTTRSQRLSEARRKGTHTGEQWAEMVSFYRGCVRCGATAVEIVKDHIIPLYQGGSDAITNLQPLCRTCNSSKGPEAIDWRSETPAGLPDKWKETPTETPANARRRTPAEGEGEGEGELNLPTTTTTTRARARVHAYDAHAVRDAFRRGDAQGIIAAFGCTIRGREGEWRAEAGGLQLGVLVVILWLAVRERSPIRQPSGFRKAREAWAQLSVEDRQGIAVIAAADLGIGEAAA